MKSIRFFCLGCLVFIFLGPPLPLLFVGLQEAVAAKDPRKIGAAIQVMFYFSVFAYWLGGFIAAGVGAIFAATSLLVVRRLSRFLKMKGRGLLAIYGGLLGLVGIGTFITMLALWSVVHGRAARIFQADPISHVIQSGLLAKLLTMYVLPTSVCGAVIWFWFVPRLISDRVEGDGKIMVAIRSKAFKELVG